MARERIPDAKSNEQRVLFGPMDQHLRAIREQLGVRITSRRGVILVEGEDSAAVRDVSKRIRGVLARVRSGKEPSTESVGRMLLGIEDPTPPARRAPPGAGPGAGSVADRRGNANGRRPSSGALPAMPAQPLRTGPLEPRSRGQARYIKAIARDEVVLAVGPAGTGKTYIAVVEAVDALRAGRVRRIVLTRPAVEAGEKLGFLPGDFHAKINPYLRPLYDALAELIPWNDVQRYMGQDVIEIVPLAYMRGRTLKDAFIILDEAQNTTAAQMKMFLTRMGEGSRIVITGDATQIDLPEGARSGLVESMRILSDVDGISVIRLAQEDIVRHPLVQRIVDAYERDESWPEHEARRRGGTGRAGPAPDAPTEVPDEAPDDTEADPA